MEALFTKQELHDKNEILKKGDKEMTTMENKFKSALHTLKLAQSGGTLQVLLDDFSIKGVQAYKLYGHGGHAKLLLEIVVEKAKVI